MTYQPKDGSISIFKNEAAKDKQPTYRGTALLNGEPYKISLWVKEGTKGKFFAGVIELDEWTKQKNGGNNPKPAPENQEPESDDLPF